VDAFLNRLLALPPESTRGSQVFDTLAARGQVDLPDVFRRIADAVPPTEATRMSFFYWNAADEFARRGRRDLLPEISSRFRTLGDSYDADVLWKIMEILMAEGLEAEALALAEHFLPIVRDDDRLMPWSVPQQCELILELRVGRCLQNPSDTPSTPEALVAELVRDLEDDIHHAAAVVDAAGVRACDVADRRRRGGRAQVAGGGHAAAPRADPCGQGSMPASSPWWPGRAPKSSASTSPVPGLCSTLSRCCCASPNAMS
jgi:hypothetical protein